MLLFIEEAKVLGEDIKLSIKDDVEELQATNMKNTEKTLFWEKKKPLHLGNLKKYSKKTLQIPKIASCCSTMHSLLPWQQHSGKQGAPGGGGGWNGIRQGRRTLTATWAFNNSRDSFIATTGNSVKKRYRPGSHRVHDCKIKMSKEEQSKKQLSLSTKELWLQLILLWSTFCDKSTNICFVEWWRQHKRVIYEYLTFIIFCLIFVLFWLFNDVLNSKT